MCTQVQAHLHRMCDNRNKSRLDIDLLVLLGSAIYANATSYGDYFFGERHKYRGDSN